MSVKILCLHGMGVNSEVFAIQTASFRALLPTYYQFQFVDAEQFCDPSPGAAEYFSGPYRCWYTSPSTAGVSRAHRKVEEIIKDQGPFQIVMGFSQVFIVNIFYSTCTSQPISNPTEFLSSQHKGCCTCSKSSSPIRA